MQVCHVRHSYTTICVQSNTKRVSNGGTILDVPSTDIYSGCPSSKPAQEKFKIGSHKLPLFCSFLETQLRHTSTAMYPSSVVLQPVAFLVAELPTQEKLCCKNLLLSENLSTGGKLRSQTVLAQFGRMPLFVQKWKAITGSMVDGDRLLQKALKRVLEQVSVRLNG